MKMMKRVLFSLAAATVLTSAQPVFAQTQPAQTQSSQNPPAALTLPHPDQPAAVLFVRLDQAQSKVAISQLQSRVAAVEGLQIVVVVSGPGAKDAPESIGAGWPVTRDADYELAGKLSVHVWPTLVALDGDGKIAGHVAGVSNTFVRDADAYLSLISGKIDQAELKNRLAAEHVVMDSPREKAARHVELSRRLMDDGKLDAARSELKQAMQLQPEDATIKLLAANAAIAAGGAEDAVAIINTIKPGEAPNWQVNVVRLHALVSLERWDEAKSLLPETLKLNPNPCEAYYLAGLIYEHEKNYPQASEAFRKACELSSKLKPGGVPPTSAPTVK